MRTIAVLHEALVVTLQALLVMACVLCVVVVCIVLWVPGQALKGLGTALLAVADWFADRLEYVEDQIH